MTLREAAHKWMIERSEILAPTSFDKEARIVGYVLESSIADFRVENITVDEVDRLERDIRNRPGAAIGESKITWALRLAHEITEQARNREGDGSSADPWLEGIRRLPIPRAAALGMASMLGRGEPIARVAERYGTSEGRVQLAVARLEHERREGRMLAARNARSPVEQSSGTPETVAA